MEVMSSTDSAESKRAINEIQSPMLKKLKDMADDLKRMCEANNYNMTVMIVAQDATPVKEETLAGKLKKGDKFCEALCIGHYSTKHTSKEGMYAFSASHDKQNRTVSDSISVNSYYNGFMEETLADPRVPKEGKATVRKAMEEIKKGILRGEIE